jgi:hypothetical protein
MKSQCLFFSGVLFLWLMTLTAHSSQNFSVSVGFGRGDIETVIQGKSAAGTVPETTGIEQALFGMAYYMASDHYSVEAVYSTRTDLIDIPEPAACAAAGSIVLLLYRKVIVSAYAKEKADE